MGNEEVDRPVRILHLSDIHFRVSSWDSDPVLRALIEFIAVEVGRGLAPDLVAITGDLAFSGSSKEYNLARIWLDKLWARLGNPPKDRLLLVPGNHDVDRRKVDFVARSVQAALLGGGDQRQIALVLSDPSQSEILLRRHAGYLKFYTEWLEVPQALPWWRREFEIRGQRLHIAGLNSAWMACGDEDRGRLLLSTYQLRETVETEQAAGSDWRVVIIHHPWDYLAEFDHHHSLSAINRQCDVLLRGHLHETRRSFVRPPSPSDTCIELATGCVYATSEFPNTFQWVELSPTKRVRVHFRAWSHGGWTIDRNQPHCPEGSAEFDLAASPAKLETLGGKPASGDFRKYLEDLWADTAYIDIRGLATGTFAGSHRGGERAATITADHHRQAKRRRPAGLARRRPRPHRRLPRQPPRRPPPLELNRRSPPQPPDPQQPAPPADGYCL